MDLFGSTYETKTDAIQDIALSQGGKTFKMINDLFTPFSLSIPVLILTWSHSNGLVWHNPDMCCKPSGIPVYVCD